ncbi:MAG TPA: efflux RND transporter permease subunit [Nocardioidaceae bacterium]|nr:efflux RND transporter permease subunit [Nocardioidaceae bacterium]
MKAPQLSIRMAGWVVLGWLAVVAVVNVGVPQLEEVVAEDSTAFVPDDAPAARGLDEMDDAFGNGRSTSVVFVVAERPGGLTKADSAYITGLVPRLKSDENVSFVQDVRRRPELLEALTSRDGEAVYLQVGIPGETGAPKSIAQIEAVREIVAEDRPDGLDVAITGPAATIADMANEVERSLVLITAVTIAVIAMILFLLYRSVVVTGIILSFIGVSLAAARGFTSLAGLHWINVSTFTASFLTGVVLGAATDYAIFLISRYQELRREGVEPREAVVTATRKVAAVITGSAFTVVVASLCMLLAKVGVFNTTGPAIALGVALAWILSLSLLPAILFLAVTRGWVEPRPARGESRWLGVSSWVVARPARALALGLLPLVLLASFYPLLTPSYDERAVQPEDTESNDGYAMVARHYPPNEMLADYVLVRADHDLRNVSDLAALEQAAASVARVEGVRTVRSVTRPLGRTIGQASVGYQAGVVGKRLGGAADRLAAGEQGATRLTGGASRLHSGAGQVADGADQAVAGAGRLLGGLRELEDGVRRLADGTDDALTGSAHLLAGADALAAGLDSAYTQTKVAVDGLGLAYQALTKSLTCGLDPYCSGAREGIRQIYVGERDQLLPGLREAAAAARQIANGSVQLKEGLTRLDAGLGRAETGARRLEAGQATMRTELGRLADGAGQVAEGSGDVEGGTAQLAGSVTRLRSGLSRAAAHLHATAKATKDPAVGGFYLPPVALEDQRFALARSVFVSEDGRVARMIVIGDTNPLGRAAMDRAGDVRRAATEGLRGTGLEASAVTVTGMAALNRDLDALSRTDFRMVAAVTLLAVFIILLLVLRSLVVAVLLLLAVAASYVSAMGLSVLFWQVLLGVQIEWTVPAIAFVLLVSVGADYNLLLMKRVREEAPDGSGAGIARALSVTAGVITAAGVIFASSMFALMAGSVTTLAQMGFTVGVGLLLDTFIVRTLVVPACAALLGNLLWWPTGRRQAADHLDDLRLVPGLTQY